ncbi:hypothetical protein [uncultured Fenollaria sp.]|uniref:hypothetical protein n=1 Tax=uncultured Fenollaria sp. TaxID=1686315 RepID=UPI0025EB32E9|nr:hypothetical protein [uncultured Fenollaria sp.]
MNKKGFTYIDTVISLCVAAIIISMFILAYRQFTNYSDRAEAKRVVQIIKKARLSAIMQMIDVEVVLDGDEIVVSNINEMKKVYKLEHLKFESGEIFQFTSEGGTKSFMGAYNIILVSNKSKKKYNVIVAAVGGQVRYEEV